MEYAIHKPVRNKPTPKKHYTKFSGTATTLAVIPCSTKLTYQQTLQLDTDALTGEENPSTPTDENPVLQIKEGNKREELNRKRLKKKKNNYSSNIYRQKY